MIPSEDEVSVAVLVTWVIVAVCVWLALIFTSCDSITEPADTIYVDTGWFEIIPTEIGLSNPTEYGEMNQWRIIIDNDTWGVEDKYIKAIRFTFFWDEEHEDVKIGFWHSGPVHYQMMYSFQSRTDYTFEVNRIPQTLSCGVITDNSYEFHGTVRLRCQLITGD